MSDDLQAFLLARIDEDEAVATAAGTTWSDAINGPWDDASSSYIAGGFYDGDNIEERHLAQMLRWHPARVVAECEAKRRIVALHEPVFEMVEWQAFICRSCGTPAPCQTLCHLAAPYSSHPDYREEWRP